VLLRFDGLAMLVRALVLYADQGWSWLAFVLLVLVPDLSASGYLVDRRVGAVAYNTVHTYTLPLALLVVSLLMDFPTGTQLALIWFAHIGADRMLGLGLKYKSGFKDTHLQRV
jgi:hypothetical protein